MSTNRGKDFENIVRSSISNLGIDITRLYDSTSGYISIHTTCDFIAYKYPTIYYIECKSIDGNTLSIAALRQLEDLLEKKKYYGTRAGFLIWYKDHRLTYWVEADYVNELKQNGDKSINIKNLMASEDNRVQLIPAVYKRVYGVYNFDKFFSII